MCVDLDLNIVANQPLTFLSYIPSWQTSDIAEILPMLAVNSLTIFLKMTILCKSRQHIFTCLSFNIINIFYSVFTPDACAH